MSRPSKVEAKISLKKTQFLLNILFTCTFVVWLLFDCLKVFPTSITPANHIVFELPGMALLGLLFATNKEPRFLWSLVLVMLIFPPVIWGILDGHLFSALAFNLAVMFSFFVGYFLQQNKRIVEKA